MMAMMVMMMPVVVTLVMLFVTGHHLNLRRIAVRHQHVEREGSNKRASNLFMGELINVTFAD